MKKNILTISLISLAALVYSQEDMRYYGAGEEGAITATTSDNGRGTDPKATYSANGMDAEYMAATRFLAQAALGYEEKHVEDVMRLGFEKWIDRQMAEEPRFLLPEYKSIIETIETREGSGNVIPFGNQFNYAWWEVNLRNEDLLRHRVAFALSEIFVISMDSELLNYPDGLSDYYDLLVEHAFGDYKELLTSVSLHPCMGSYLGHFHNQKSDPSNNIFPDENYAREIMQLFSIGLYELNQDGSRKKDDSGNYIPTYDNNDIREMAKIFTGLGMGDWSPFLYDELERNGEKIPTKEFDPQLDLFSISRTDLMDIYNEWHEPGEKVILKKYTIPSGQTGLEDIDDAIDILFNHDNVGPFICNKLIQRLVKSNPSSAYIERVAGVFENNGRGERGDLGAVVKSILLDDEARSCIWQMDETHGMLREPIVRLSQLYRYIPKDSPLGYYWNGGFRTNEMVKQHPLMSPSVFNFFLPDFQPTGVIAESDLVGPEFQIHDTQSSVGYFNWVYSGVIFGELFRSREDQNLWGENLTVFEDLQSLDVDTNDHEEIINLFDTVFAHGRIDDFTRNILRDALKDIDNLDKMYKVKLALYLVMTSANYSILK